MHLAHLFSASSLLGAGGGPPEEHKQAVQEKAAYSLSHWKAHLSLWADRARAHGYSRGLYRLLWHCGHFPFVSQLALSISTNNNHENVQMQIYSLPSMSEMTVKLRAGFLLRGNLVITKL